MKPRELLSRILLSLVGLFVALILAEIVLRVANSFSPRPKPIQLSDKIPLHVVCDAPYLYQLNPEHPEISAQGLRDREFAIPKPKGVFRILVLGDSVTFGVGVRRDQTFPKVLERELNRRHERVEVLNAGVNGYTAYNEVQYYLHKGRLFEPDLVLIVFCLNDIVDPQLHWNYTKNAIKHIPDESIPNPEYHKTRTAPEYRNNPTLLADLRNRQETRKTGLDRFMLYRLIRLRLASKRKGGRIFDEKWYDKVRDKWWPTYITGEDPISIKVLLDYDSPEWRWLRKMYGRLVAAVRQDGARLVVVQVPLAYQLDKNYPFVPQKMMEKYCAEQSVHCRDLLPALRKYKAREIFFLRHDGVYDIWHLTEKGHRVVAKELARFLERNQLVR